MDSKYRLAELSDEALLSNVKLCVGSENQITALVLAHLAEIDARGAYRLWACASLVSYCVYELRLSEDEAQRRCRAARAARQFPMLFEMLADASIHLTGIVLLAPHLTPENQAELLARARYRTKREIEKLVAQIAPRSDVPTLIEPLGPAADGFRVPAPSSWSSFVHGLAGYVRELAPGTERTQAPSASPDWLEATLAGGQDDNPTPVTDSSPNMPAAEVCSVPPESDQPLTAPALLASMRYRIQFTADQAYVDMVERARDLLGHQVPDRDLAIIQRLAIEALLDKLNRRKYGASNTPGHTPAVTGSDAPTESRSDELPIMMNASRGPDSGATDMAVTLETTPPRSAAPARHSAPSRHVPAALRRSVVERDGGRCSYVDSRGVRCRETARLEFHHERAYALGGTTDLHNIKLRCRAHNDLAAELDFGRRFMQRKKHGEPPRRAESAAPARNGGGLTPNERE